MGLIFQNETVPEGADFITMQRIVGLAGAAIVQADVTSIARSVYDVTDTDGGTLTTGPTVVVVSTSVFDTLQTDARWTKDATGYNFRDTVSAASVPDGDKDYQVEYTFTMADGTTLRPDPIGVHTQNWRTD